MQDAKPEEPEPKRDSRDMVRPIPLADRRRFVRKSEERAPGQIFTDWASI